MHTIQPFIALLLIPALTVAQSTTPANRSTAPTNRQQELYDQYHGITRKTPPQPTASTQYASGRANATPRTTTDQTATMTRTARPETGMAYDGPGTRIGIRGGGTYQFFLDNPSTALSSVKGAPGFVGGLTFTFGSGGVAFQPEVNYSRYTTDITTTYINTTLSSRITIDYLEVPLLLKFQSGSYAGNRFFFNVGPYGSYALSAAIDGKKQTLNQDDGRYSYGAMAGLGVAIKAGPGHVTIEARGRYQLGDLSEGFYTDSKIIPAQATIGYIFALGGRQ